MDEKEESISSKISSSNFNETDAITEKSTCKNKEENKKFFPKKADGKVNHQEYKECKTQQIVNQDTMNNGEYLCS